MLDLSDFFLMPDDPEATDAVKFVETAVRIIGAGFDPEKLFWDYRDTEGKRRIPMEIDALGLDSQLREAKEILSEEFEDVDDIVARLEREEPNVDVRPDAVL